ncbi:TPA: hypothetical protein ACJI8J_004854 [Kluyvera georgiana]|uniref:Uncharacterized protein n=1 Tax=Kluyvera georgiana ATCC 51603 TaxID=1354264 RepID=A0A1B7JV93_9ENTR|nr:hypothetical protein [Kluyvera georgiana]OAT51792.1 hypothetical protein M989_02801 [Kluyvera georgiana ATCC 51603]
MKQLKWLLIFLFLPFAVQASNNAGDLTTQCSHSGKETILISDATIDKYVSSVIYQGTVETANVNMRINGTYYVAILSAHSDWTGYPGGGADIAKVGFTAYTLGKKVSACVSTNTGFLYGLSF